MKRYSGRGLFPDPNQIYRIRRVISQIMDEVSERLNRRITFDEFADELNVSLTNKGLVDETPVSSRTLNRLSRFGSTNAKSSDANTLTLLESLPLLHVLSSRYSEEDLQRIALGQPLAKDNTVELYRDSINELKNKLVSALVHLDGLTNKNVIQISNEVELTVLDKQIIFERILAYSNNVDIVREMGIVDFKNIEAYMNSDIPETVILALLANCEIPGYVRVLLQKKEPSLNLDPNYHLANHPPLDDIV